MIETPRLRHLKQAWDRHKTLDTLMIVAACILFSSLAVMSRPAPNELIVERLEFHDGHFFQYVRPTQTETILGQWAAEIVTAEGDGVCSGGGTAPYEIKEHPKKMNPNYWTGDTCELVEGQIYVANAVWQWIGEKGYSHRISRSLTFRYEAERP